MDRCYCPFVVYGCLGSCMVATGVFRCIQTCAVAFRRYLPDYAMVFSVQPLASYRSAALFQRWRAVFAIELSNTRFFDTRLFGRLVNCWIRALMAKPLANTDESRPNNSIQGTARKRASLPAVGAPDLKRYVISSS